MVKNIYKNEFNEMISYLWLGSRRGFFFKLLKKHGNKNFLLEVISSSTDKKLKKNISLSQLIVMFLFSIGLLDIIISVT